MKRKTTYEYMALIFLAAVTGAILYRQINAPSPIPVYARSERPTADVPITPRERQVIREYLAAIANSTVGKHRLPLPPGFARTTALRELPPDWNTKLVKGETLPSEIYRACHPLPKELASRLPSAPLGTVLVAIDGRVLRVGRTSFTVLDVFDTRTAIVSSQ